MSTRIIFVRHGNTEANSMGLFVGRMDVELSSLGKRQVEVTANWLEKKENIDILFSSTMKRAFDTAKGINAKGTLEHKCSAQWNEMDFGDWEGKKHEEIATQNPEQYIIWETKPHLHTIPNAESIAHIHTRVVDEFLNILNEYQDKTICIVSHGVTLKVLMAYIKGLEISQVNEVTWFENTSISVIEYQNQSFRIELENFTGHLPEELKSDSYAIFDRIFREQLGKIEHSA